MSIRNLRLAVQIVLGLILLNMTAIGAYVISPLLPVLRFDYPNIPGTVQGGQRVCDIGIVYRNLSTYWPLEFLALSLAILILICAVLGRTLCAWLCPIGLIQDLLTRLRTALRINPKEFSLKTHDRLVLVKYAVFLLAILLAAAEGLSLIASYTAGFSYKSLYPEGTAQVAPFCSVCPAPDIYYMGTVINTGNFLFSDPTRYIAWIVLLGLFIGGFAIARFWCRYFCPVGATSSFFNKVSLLSIKKQQTQKCTNCNYCVNVCPMRIRKVKEENRAERVVDLNCTFCLECIETCPEKALSLTLGEKKIYRGGKVWWQKISS